MKLRPPHFFSLVLFCLAPATMSAEQASMQQRQYTSKFGKTQLEVLQQADGQRDFKLQSGTLPSARTWTDAPSVLQIRTKNPLLDALFSLAQQEVSENSVNEITDWSFNDQQPVLCPCFETGAKWHYVWTRDLSYSLDLGLSYLDPERSRHSLLFKTSKVRPELVARGLSQTEVALQDTGSGGSWPISSDRVVWVLAASGLSSKAADGSSSADAQQVWQQQWFSIAQNTLQQDRQYLYSADLGLYRGETSFLDWREQSYPSWTAKDTVFLAESFALSTNVLHYVALQKAAAAADVLDPEAAKEFRSWADALKTAINKAFWLPEQGLYASYIGTEQHPQPIAQFDLLGLALAIEHGIASKTQAQQILANYPLAPAGPPVIFPAQSQVPIYHNRAVWPFVTAYALRAAKSQQHGALFSKLAMSMFQGAALHGSNMENFEWLTMRAHVEDGALSGPVVNSTRQLWSVAGFHDFVAGDLFGVKVAANQLKLDPYLPGQLVKDLQLGEQLQLLQLPIGASTLDVSLQLNGQAKAQQSFRLSKALLNGVAVELTAEHQLVLDIHQFSMAHNQLALELTPVSEPEQLIRTLRVEEPARITERERRQLFAPVAPTLIAQQNSKGQLELKFDANGAVDTRFTLYKNGAVVKTKTGKGFVESKVAKTAQCYSLVQTDKETGLTSLPGRTLCTDAGVQTFIAGSGLHSTDHELSSYLDQPVYKNWGQPEQQLQLTFTPEIDAKHGIKLQYFIDNGPINTGITAVVKQADVVCEGMSAQQVTLVMPHLATATEAGSSSQGYFRAKAGKPCQITIKDGFNMSYLQHFELYTGGKGGRSGPLNQAVIQAARIQPVADNQPVKDN
jgi:hypothetical protein